MSEISGFIARIQMAFLTFAIISNEQLVLVLPEILYTVCMPLKGTSLRAKHTGPQFSQHGLAKVQNPRARRLTLDMDSL